MWLLSFIPTWFFHAIPITALALIIASMFLKAIPFINAYYQPLRVIGFTLLLIGVFFEGGIFVNQDYVKRIEEMREKIAQAEQQSKVVNEKIVEKIVVKREMYREKGKDIIQYVDREVVKYDSKCEIPNEFVSAHNKAAEQIK